MSWPPDRPNLSTITVGRMSRYPRLAPRKVSASAANGRATASARSESATMPGAAPDLPRWPLSRRCASGPANSSMPAVQASDTARTGTMAARRMAGTRSSWPRRRSRAMKLTSPTHAPSPATVSTIRKSEIAVKKAPATGLLYSRVITTVSARVVIAATRAPIRFRALPRATSLSRGPAGLESGRAAGNAGVSGRAASGMAATMSPLLRLASGLRRHPRPPVAKRGGTKRDVVKRDGEKRDEVKRDGARPDGAKRDEAKRDGVKRDEARPDGAKRDEAKRDGVKRDEARPDGARPDGARPDG